MTAENYFIKDVKKCTKRHGFCPHLCPTMNLGEELRNL